MQRHPDRRIAVWRDSRLKVRAIVADGRKCWLRAKINEWQKLG